MALQLVIGNKNYSSWSMRPWVLMKALGLPFDEVKLRFDFGPGAPFAAAAAKYSPTFFVIMTSAPALRISPKALSTCRLLSAPSVSSRTQNK